MKKILLSSLLVGLSATSLAQAQELDDSFTVSYTSQASCEMVVGKDPTTIGEIKNYRIGAGHSATRTINSLDITCNKGLPYTLKHTPHNPINSNSNEGRLVGINSGAKVQYSVALANNVGTLIVHLLGTSPANSYNGVGTGEKNSFQLQSRAAIGSLLPNADTYTGVSTLTLVF